MGDRTTVAIPGWQFTSYFSVASNLCWLLEPELSNEIIRLHRVVGNAITEVGASEPVTVVSAAPYYYSYPTATDCLKSSLFRWGGNARAYDGRALCRAGYLTKQSRWICSGFSFESKWRNTVGLWLRIH
ncbi:hypothetical protein MLD38_036646 [Melastoma candidum]|uniref:Uncharacterized protein n=1 Tax=Melastoma candidum TaxID=119954 RepID=A0ACB9LM77_9MYRT|nr:hypothetical protein MLD38_036646 [Melastoma candidum]